MGKRLKLDASFLIFRESACPSMQRVIRAAILILASVALHVSDLGIARKGQIVRYVKVDIKRLNVDLHLVAQGASSDTLVTHVCQHCLLRLCDRCLIGLIETQASTV